MITRCIESLLFYSLYHPTPSKENTITDILFDNSQFQKKSITDIYMSVVKDLIGDINDLLPLPPNAPLQTFQNRNKLNTKYDMMCFGSLNLQSNEQNVSLTSCDEGCN